MVGLVLVSHSRALADALVGLLRQVASTELPIAIAAGIGEDRSEFGTDAVEIMEAIQSVRSEEGVVVFMDLGSAVLSAKMALELLPPEMTGKIRFCGAPMIEGAIAAAVQIGLTDDLDAICREANAARTRSRRVYHPHAHQPAWLARSSRGQVRADRRSFHGERDSHRSDERKGARFRTQSECDCHTGRD
jgi:phosphocarrier protein FPr